MKKIKNKILALIMLTIMIISQILPIKLIAADLPQTGDGTYATVDDYLERWGGAYTGEVDEYGDYTYEEIENYSDTTSKQDVLYIELDLINYEITDLSGIYNFPNLTKIYINGLDEEEVIDFTYFKNLVSLDIENYHTDIEKLKIEKLKKLEELNLHGELEGELILYNNVNLESIDIYNSNEDLSKFIIDIRGLYAVITDFRYRYDASYSTGFDLEKCILFNVLENVNLQIEEGSICWDHGGYGTALLGYSYYESIDDYLENHVDNYDSSKKSEMKELVIGEVWDLVFIEDMSGLEEFVNLETLVLEGVCWIEGLNLENLNNVLTLRLCADQVTNLIIEDVTDYDGAQYTLVVDWSLVDNSVKATGIENMKCLENLENLSIVDYDNYLDLSKFKNLRELYYEGSLNQVEFSENTQLEEITIMSTRTDISVDISRNTNIRIF